jgi:beta-fructofuranosidase
LSVNYKPPDGWAADFIPFYWEGEFHLFYLKDFRDLVGHGEGTPWCHLVTSDFVHFTDYGECLPRGRIDEQDLYVFTGSVIHGNDNLFHIFYTGHNPHFPELGKPTQAILHAVSPDLMSWKKLPEEVFYAPTDRFEPHDWRDPFVFWNESAGEYWMLTAARLKEGPSRRRGCLALSVSHDLHSWEVKDPFYAPGLYFTHECPDLFQMGEYWYLIFSEFSDATLTRYRMSPVLASGELPLSDAWLTPRVDSFDGRAFYAAKTASDGQHRYLFGWNPTREHEQDNGSWQWGGNLVVHKLFQEANGTLSVGIPETVAASFNHSLPVRFERGFGIWIWQYNQVRLAGGGLCCASAGKLPETCRIDIQLNYESRITGCGVMLRSSHDFESGYYIRLEPQRQRLVFDSWPRPGDIPFMPGLEQPLITRADEPIQITIYVDGSLCEIYVNQQVALSARMYDHPVVKTTLTTLGEWGVFTTGDGGGCFSRMQLFIP